MRRSLGKGECTFKKRLCSQRRVGCVGLHMDRYPHGGGIRASGQSPGFVEGVLLMDLGDIVAICVVFISSLSLNA